jgi:ATP synthase protein I
MAEGNDDYRTRIAHERRLREERRRKGERPFWSGVATLGLLGWMIVIPTLIGAFLGRWIDQTLNSGVFWTLSLMMAGLAGGCYNAWRAMHEK